MGFDITYVIIFIPLVVIVVIAILAVKFAEWHVTIAHRLLRQSYRLRLSTSSSKGSPNLSGDIEQGQSCSTS